MTTDERLDFFGQLILSTHPLYSWCYDPDMFLRDTNCPSGQSVDALLSIDGMRDRVRSFAQRNDKPILLTNELSLMWIAAPERGEEGLSHIRMIGPFLLVESARTAIEQSLRSFTLSAGFKAQISGFVRSLPVLSLSRIFEYALMLHYAVTGETIHVSDLHYESSPDLLKKQESAFSEEIIVHGTYEAEQAMLQKVREGDMSFVDEISRMTVMGTLGQLSRDNSIRQYKNAVEVCITLFSRAAIEGGLAPETAMTLTDKYFQSVEAVRTIPELTEVSTTMQTDFVERVHKAKQREAYSKAVRQCLSYMELHLEEPLSIADLARQTGYTEYYLSKKFRRETGETIKVWLSRKRLERAAFLLAKTAIPIHDIAGKLQYSSQSYFTEQFRKHYGISPAVYREQNRHA